MEMFILKEKIIKETLNLLNTKTFDKITIKDITDNLNISRQAFYYHFNDLYEVVETICTNSYKMVTNTYTDLEDWKFVYLYILRLIYTHKDVVSNIYKTIEREYVDNILYNSLFPYVENVIIKQSKNLNVEKKDIDFISKYFTLSFIAITSDWIKNGMKEKPEILVRNVYLIINNDFKKALNNFEKNNKKVDIFI